MIYNISNLVDAETPSILNSMFGGNCCNAIDGVHLIYCDSVLIGFFQVIPYDEHTFKTDYDLYDYNLSSLNDNKFLTIQSLYILEEYHGKGIGTSIVNHIKNSYNYSLVLYSSPDAETFWMQQGFEELNVFSSYVYIYLKETV